eukprot:364993-Chlamydomonas_euryale.AAC.10
MRRADEGLLALTTRRNKVVAKPPGAARARALTPAARAALERGAVGQPPPGSAPVSPLRASVKTEPREASGSGMCFGRRSPVGPKAAWPLSTHGANRSPPWRSCDGVRTKAEAAETAHMGALAVPEGAEDGDGAGVGQLCSADGTAAAQAHKAGQLQKAASARPDPAAKTAAAASQSKPATAAACRPSKGGGAAAAASVGDKVDAKAAKKGASEEAAAAARKTRASEKAAVAAAAAAASKPGAVEKADADGGKTRDSEMAAAAANKPGAGEGADVAAHKTHASELADADAAASKPDAVEEAD